MHLWNVKEHKFKNCISNGGTHGDYWVKSEEGVASKVHWHTCSRAIQWSRILCGQEWTRPVSESYGKTQLYTSTDVL